ncbi:LTV1 ribosome biogenesis factor [Brevipalpus obovatus]|uniref:LTV1 ribosome biogenesis factor n=1 Tax=Brevipalpus obovatus TaxID=246614 RepID=UPI003D9F7964
MPKKARPRIDKKSAITFKLVNRSQNDPLVADEAAPQHVLMEVKTKDDKMRKEEQRKYGIEFDDDYDYLKHLKTSTEFEKEWQLVEKKQPRNKNALRLPSSVFPSIIEEDEGMLNKAVLPTGPQPDLDPDVMAALDDDFDFENPNNVIDEDFVAQALFGDGVESGDEEPEEGEETEETESECDSQDLDNMCFSDDDENNQRRGKMFSKEETRSCFTNYSLTSSVVARNEGKTLIDEKFEALFEREYADDMEIGALDCEEIEGHKDPNEFLQRLIGHPDPNHRVQYEPPSEKIRVPLQEESDEETRTLEIDDLTANEKEKPFDCESILSTYSNLYNHPKLIQTERSGNFRKLKIDSSGIVSQNSTALTKKNLKVFDNQGGPELGSSSRSVGSRLSTLTILSERPKNETPEERKERKAAFKQFKKERRIEKKANKEAFKLEENNHHKEITRLRNGLNAVKLV